MIIEYTTGYAAESVADDGEIWDLGAGWSSLLEAEADLVDCGADMTRVKIYRARTYDDWESWEEETEDNDSDEPQYDDSTFANHDGTFADND